MKKNVFFKLLSIVLLVNACSGDLDIESSIQETNKSILNFEFKQGLNSELDTDVFSQIIDMDIVVTVPFGTNITALKPSINFLGKEVTPASEVAQDFSQPVAYKVTAQDGTTSVYTVKVIVSPASSKDISSFIIKSIDNPSIGTSDIEATIIDTNISFTLPFGSDINALKPVITHTGTSLNPENEQSIDFSKTVSYIVTAANGTTKEYTVTAILSPSNEKDITVFEFKASLNPGIGTSDISATIDENNNIGFAVPFGTDLKNLRPTITQLGASISPDNESPQDFNNPITYTVTAADGTTKDYIATATVNPSNEKDITSFVFKASLNPAIGILDIIATIDKNNHINFEVPFGTDLKNLKPTITQLGTTITPKNETTQDFSNPITYTVTAADGTTKSYIASATVGAYINSKPNPDFTIKDQIDHFVLENKSTDIENDPMMHEWISMCDSIVIRKNGSIYYFDLPYLKTPSSFKVKLITRDAHSESSIIREIDLPVKTLIRRYGLGTRLDAEKSNDLDYNWYYDQYGTGVDSGNNCGPTCSTMAIKWVNQSFDKTPLDARNKYNRVPDPNNNNIPGVWWMPGTIKQYLLDNNVVSNITPKALTVSTFDSTIKSYIDSNKLVILNPNMYYVRAEVKTINEEAERHVDKFYDTNILKWGHYIILKGYKVVDGKTFYEVYDPYSMNERYKNNKLKGMDRYYRSEDLIISTVGEWWKFAIIVNK